MSKNIVNYDLAEYFYKAGLKNENSDKVYNKETKELETRTLDVTDKIPAFTVLEVIDWLWSTGKAIIYYKFNGINCNAELQFPMRSKIYRPGLTFETPSDVFIHCLDIYAKVEKGELNLL